jgi:hypothetical protein
MKLFSQALSGMSRQAAFEPKAAAEAKQDNIEISDEAAISRFRPIRDGIDYWQEPRSSANTDSGGSAPG